MKHVGLALVRFQKVGLIVRQDVRTVAACMSTFYAPQL